MLSRIPSQQCILSHPAAPKGVLTICAKMRGKEGEKRGETNWQREKERKREAERYRTYSPPCFSSSLAPRGFSKAFSEKKKKQAAVRWIKQQQQPLSSLPSRLLALIFQSLSVPMLRLFYTLPGKWIFSFGSFSSPHYPIITSPPPPPTSLSHPPLFKAFLSQDWLAVKLAGFVFFVCFFFHVVVLVERCILPL